MSQIVFDDQQVLGSCRGNGRDVRDGESWMVSVPGSDAVRHVMANVCNALFGNHGFSTVDTDADPAVVSR
eukprot:10142702-Heterocapsa_arctica.AAC.1